MAIQFSGYLIVKEAAAYLGVSPATLRNWDRAGKLKPRRHPVNGYRLYRKEDLEQILRRVDSAGGPPPPPCEPVHRQPSQASVEGPEQ